MAIKRILVPVDFSGHSGAALKYACELAALTGAVVHVLHVLERHVTSIPEFGLGLAVPHSVPEPLAAAERALAELVDASCAPGQELVRAFVPGTPGEAIADYVRNQHVDLIVMSTHGRSGLAHALMGSVAERAVRSAPCPVLTIRPSAT